MNRNDISCKVETIKTEPCKIETCKVEAHKIQTCKVEAGKVKVEDEEPRNNPLIPLTMPWMPQKEQNDENYSNRDIIPAFYNYTLFSQFLNFMENVSYNQRIVQERVHRSPPRLPARPIPSFPSKNKNVRQGFDDIISPAKSLKLNTFDGQKVKLEDGFQHAESNKTLTSKAPLSEAGLEAFLNANIPSNIIDKKVPKEKSNQNPRKNLPGLVLQRIRATCMSYLGNKTKGLSVREEGRLKYVKDIFDQFNPEEIKTFQEYFMTMDKNSKTWKSTSDYIYGNKVFSHIIHMIIEKFLGEEGTIDFEDWLLTGKMTAQTKQVIRESKDWLIQKYKEVVKNRAACPEN